MRGEYALRRNLVDDNDLKPELPSKLRVGRADDPAEARADRFASVVEGAMRASWPETESVDRSDRIRRSTSVRAAARTTKPGSKVRRAATHDPLGGTVVDQSTAQAITSVSGGNPVPETVRRAAEEASGQDLGGVRVHEGAASAKLSASLQATAFTVGSNIFLGGDAARPGTSSGNRLLAHELGHVVEESASSPVGRVRRLASGTELRAELGGPSALSKTYRKIIGALDAYEAVLSWKPVGDNAGLLKDADTLDLTVKAVIDACAAFLSGHKNDKRAPRVTKVKSEAERERAALTLRAAELKRGVKPTWASWKEAIATTSETTTRDIKAEKGFAVGGDKGNMNEVTKLSFGPRVKMGTRGGSDAFFKADKATVAPLEAAFAEDIGVPRGPGFENGEESGPRFAQRAVAASRIDKLLNANVIAKTQLAVHNTAQGPVRGQIMEKAKGRQAAHFRPDIAEGRAPGSDIDDPELQRMLSKLDLVDSLCGQIDRHAGNFFIDRDKATGKVTSVTGIDNDMAFGTKNFTPGETEAHNEYAGIGRYIDKETGEAVLRLTTKDLHAVLDDLLLPNEVEAAIERLLATQKILKEAKDDGRLIGPERWGADTVGAGGIAYGTKVAGGYHADLFHRR